MPREWTYTKAYVLTEETDYCLVKNPDGSFSTKLPEKPWPNGVCPATLVRPCNTSINSQGKASYDPEAIFIYKWPEGFAEAYYLCPCGCGAVHSLSLKPAKANNHADWDCVIEPSGRVTFSPSINYLCGCKSHYFIRDGKVQWC